MKFFIIGHRGSGKTFSLKTIKEFFRDAQIKGRFFDLDEEIEKYHGSIHQIFSMQGEEFFRKAEAETLERVLKESAGDTPVFISLGAGFAGDLSFADEVIWIRRESDKEGRIFLDRPALDPHLPPLQEWFERFQKREARYKRIHTQVLTLPEGKWLAAKTLGQFFSHWFPKLNSEHERVSFDATLIPDDLPGDRFKKKSFYRDAKRVEIREDLIGSEIPEGIESKIYFSYRKTKSDMTRIFDFEDWDLSLGKPEKEFWSYSLHEDGFEDSLAASLPKGAVLKWAPEVKSFKMLHEGHKWFLEDINHRAFLPRSADGRWRWYRRLFGPQMPIHFVRDYQGSSPDQPFWYESNLIGFQNQGFAAVLGGKVSLSWSPSYHCNFFKEHKMPFVSIDLSEEEFDEGFEVLRALGLRAAAVTSPLKSKAFTKVTRFANPADRGFKSINTLFLEGEETFGSNTDLPGVLSAHSELNHSSLSLIIWGGGGIQPILKEAFPKAAHAKAREGMELTKDSIIIWASTRSNQVRWPKPLKFVKKVVDMNYSESSMGRELARMTGADYVSGEEFFVKQASLQQEFWSRYL